ncbi:PREDICTED: uncharacterized protein LOC102027589 isoform X2 [Chinchilla lanigera]|uniref:uncharacterized protein LOC102027589 isoform X2 n=1 Tax=Chinchilla lanigera TaxID=34839 RepID=UPI00069755B9|nr:PREDICTED: uncharacterized protein LOC102027589 isoform X2 [Chinchilla lanigera]
MSARGKCFHQQAMSESSSDQNTSSQEIRPSNSSYYSDPRETHTLSALSRDRRTLYSRSDSGISSLLPSDSCKHLTWHEVEQHDVQGSQLRCPRVREGPSEEALLCREVGCSLPPKRRTLEKTKWEAWLQENWEECTNLNISFQDLGDPYQIENFKRILRRLIRVETLWLVDNSLVDLSAIRLPRYLRYSIYPWLKTTLRPWMHSPVCSARLCNPSCSPGTLVNFTKITEKECSPACQI